ncbi:transcriptional regulator ATRX-like [Uranotaenia lowii]|uniref:transcriptional regulator ATRX-like n=1 Tax=Uranotaenia lowii TaxID=190385 RepID=UPI00247986F7|nr:transcriptional regulator ATRX-like [Uranotaenia lowii]XP_055609967.1 transcriptional regulator ATRX-like [Uranotaenia lowii]XP_055609975.1 transcriptional regulator ATRX-like [Uranotaenia lowii]
MAAVTHWTLQESMIMIRKRLELLASGRTDKVYEQVSEYLAMEHNIFKSAVACTTRFNNLLKSYRTCVKRMEAGGNGRIRFPYFDVFHQYYGTSASTEEDPPGKCKNELLLEDGFDNEVGDDVNLAEDHPILPDNIDFTIPVSGTNRTSMDDEPVRKELTSTLTASQDLQDLKVRLMKQKLLYYTNQNMILRMKQNHYKQKDQERVRKQLFSSEILKILRGIQNCLKNFPPSKEPTEKKPTEVPEPIKVEHIQPIKEKDPPKPPPVELKPAPPEHIQSETEPEPTLDGEEEEEEEEEEPEPMESDSGMLPVYEESEGEAEAGGEEEEEDEEEEAEEEEEEVEEIKEIHKSPDEAMVKVKHNIFPPWNRIQTVLLIKIHCDLRPKFNGHNLFECVSNKLIELNVNRTSRDCRIRWNNLFRTYRECRLRLKANAAAPVKFEYFQDIDSYFKERPCEELGGMQNNVSSV